MSANTANTANTPEVVYPDLSYQIVGILFKVHNELGTYRNEKQICDRIEFYLREAKLQYVRELELPSSFDGEKRGRNRVDFLIENQVILEVKNVRILEREHYYQVRRYLKAYNKKLGMLVNFRDKFLKPRRVLNSEYTD